MRRRGRGLGGATMTGEGWVAEPIRSHAAVGRLRSQLAADPIGAVAIDSFLEPGVAKEVSGLLVRSTFHDEHRLFGVDTPVDETRWRDAEDRTRVWRVGRIADVGPRHRLGPGVIALLRLRGAAASLRGWLEEVLDRPLGDATAIAPMRLDPGHSVRPHVLDPASARAQVHVFLSPSWDPRWGGEQVVVGPAERARRIVPGFNRAVLCDGVRGATIFVAPRTPSAPPRLSLVVSFASAGAGASG